MAITLYLIHQFIRHGQWFQFGYKEERWTTPFSVGLYGLLLSSGKGLIFYSPLAILALAQYGFQGEKILAKESE
jgi:hypothetical protein